MWRRAAVSVQLAALLGCAVTLRGADDGARNEPPLHYWAEQLAGGPLPETARTRAPFEALPPGTTFPELLRRVGPPDEELGTDLRAYVWRLDDGDRIEVTTPDGVAVQSITWVQPRTHKRVLLLGR